MDSDTSQQSSNSRNGLPAAAVKQDMSGSEFLEYVELKLWSGFERKLWLYAGLILVLYSLAGTFGIVYYIDSKIEARTKEAEVRYSEKSETLLQYAKLQILLTEAYSTKKLELAQQVVLAVQGIEHAKATVNDQKVRNQLEGARFYLIQDVSWDEYANEEVGPKNLKAIALPAADLYPNIPILPPRRIEVQQALGGRFIGGTSAVHAVNDGTLRGVMLDVKFRIVQLRAYRKAMDHINRRILEYGGDTDFQKMVKKIAVAAAVDQEFFSAYERYVAEASDKLLLDEERKIFQKYGYLYRIENIAPPSKANDSR